MLTGSCHCGAVRWTFTERPVSATACNCTACRRYGVLWIYGWEGHGVTLSGATSNYVRSDSGHIDFRFCPRCGNVAAWRGLRPHDDGRTRIAVNLRLCDLPDEVMELPIDHFDGLDTFEDLGQDGRKVRDMWF